jgi:MFS transporter, YNFM family, putative membrane transport protein
VFLVYALGSVASTTAGHLADRFGRRAVVPVCTVVMLLGLLGTVASPLLLVVAALAVMTVGSSVAGAAAGRAWSAGGWTGVLVLTGTLALLGCGVAAVLARSASLLPPGNPPVGG